MHAVATHCGWELGWSSFCCVRRDLKEVKVKDRLVSWSGTCTVIKALDWFCIQNFKEEPCSQPEPINGSTWARYMCDIIVQVKWTWNDDWLTDEGMRYEYGASKQQTPAKAFGRGSNSKQSYHTGSSGSSKGLKTTNERGFKLELLQYFELTTAHL